MDGLLIIDKPSGPTSHDVVSRMRRLLRERRVGHTGTLDPAATGVLLIVVGRATRLARFLSDNDKSYEAVVRFGFSTDTADAEGQPIGPVSQARLPSRSVIETALGRFRGTFLQQPPAFSAKKIDGTRSYKIARAAAHARLESDARQTASLPALPAQASVTVHRLEIVAIEADCVTLDVHCSAGFYVRSLAHDLGQRLGIGAHLAGLRRTRSGDFTLDQAVSLDTAERDPQHAIDALIPPAEMLPGLPSVTLNAEGVLRAVHGRALDIDNQRGIRDAGCLPGAAFVRLLDQSGQLVGIAEHTDALGILHPSVVLV
jgi:tRNA pseudouridine55 synthase